MRRPMNARGRIAVLIALVGIALIASPVRTGVADLVGSTLGLHGAKIVPANPANPANALVAAETPAVNPAQESSAESIVRADGRIAKLFGGVPYQVEHVGPWSTGGSPNRLIGVVLFVSLSQPATVTATWPIAEFTPRSSFPQYAERSAHATVVGLRRARINIDLSRRRVVGVVPSEYSSRHG
jgi:hypothetical protein